MVAVPPSAGRLAGVTFALKISGPVSSVPSSPQAAALAGRANSRVASSASTTNPIRRRLRFATIDLDIVFPPNG
jgi:hypothetical protein